MARTSLWRRAASVVVLSAAVPLVVFGQSQADLPESCPAGYQLASNRITVGPSASARPAKDTDWSRGTISVDIPATAQLLTVSAPARHPKFCWKEESSTGWECRYTEGHIDRWARWLMWRPGQPSPRGSNYKRYQVTFQNESSSGGPGGRGLTRNAMLTVCYRDTTVTKPIVFGINRPRRG
jgi:hypothetical protein